MNNVIKYVSKEEYALNLKTIEELKEKLHDENMTKEARFYTMKILQEKVENLKNLKIVDEIEQEDKKGYKKIA